MVRRALGILAVSSRSSSAVGLSIRRLECGMYPLRISIVTEHRIPGRAALASAARCLADVRPTPPPRPPAVRSAGGTGLDTHHADELFDGVGGALERGTLVLGEIELDDLLRTARSELDRDADEEALDAILALESDRAGQDLLAVEHDRVDHLGDCRGRRVVGAARFEEVDDLGAAIAGT